MWRGEKPKTRPDRNKKEKKSVSCHIGEHSTESATSKLINPMTLKFRLIQPYSSI